MSHLGDTIGAWPSKAGRSYTGTTTPRNPAMAWNPGYPAIGEHAGDIAQTDSATFRSQPDRQDIFRRPQIAPRILGERPVEFQARLFHPAGQT
jgi:hypothetical protein